MVGLIRAIIAYISGLYISFALRMFSGLFEE